MDPQWPVRLFSKSVLKQRKFKEISNLLADTHGLQCLDIGSDNGVISYLLRKRGGRWKSADLDEAAVRATRELVQADVFQIDGRHTPFGDNEFDLVVIVDFLEHVQTDREFIGELRRIVRPGGTVILNVPHAKVSLLRKLRLALGQTDQKHGHVRPGYTVDSLTDLLNNDFTMTSSRTYSKFFSECIDTIVTAGLGLVKGDEGSSRKGVLVTGRDMRRHRTLFAVYSVIYPVMWVFAKLDALLVWNSGYMLIATARSGKVQ